MKNTLSIILLFIAFLPPIVLSGAIDRVATYLQQGDATQLAKSAAENVEISILDDDNTMNAAQMQAKLQVFFSANKPISIKIIHRIESNPNLIYAITILHTANGNFRVSYKIRSNGSNFELTEMRFENEKDL